MRRAGSYAVHGVTAYRWEQADGAQVELAFSTRLDGPGCGPSTHPQLQLWVRCSMPGERWRLAADRAEWLQWAEWAEVCSSIAELFEALGVRGPCPTAVPQ